MGKALYKGQDAYSTVKGIVDGAKVVFSGDARIGTGARLLAAAGVVGELSGASDLYKGAKGLGKAAKLTDNGTDAAKLADKGDQLHDATKKVHGNTAGDQTAVLYKRTDQDGNLQKWGVSQDPDHRYTSTELGTNRVTPVVIGHRGDMLTAERKLVETNPGPMNKEPWAGTRKPDDK